MLGARFGVRAAEVGHLAVLSAHGCMACRVYWLGATVKAKAFYG
jgi:hypothetical protein